MSPRITRAAYPMKRAWSGNDAAGACGHVEIGFVQKRGDTQAGWSPTPRQFPLRQAVQLRVQGAEQCVAVAALSPLSAAMMSEEIVDSTGTFLPAKRPEHL